ncbi:MAG: oligosaccharide flippase family protein [Calothrix sp. FI2-JRJ7]|nr:oligosaccharide flippase family protein [Calothrix sp. FI2-JRJ7]
MFLSQGLRIILQAIYFIIIPRALGSQEYGIITAASTLVAIVYPFGSLGYGTLIIKNISRNRALFPEYWGNALFMIALSGLILCFGVLALSPVFIPGNVSILLVILFAVNDLFFFKTLETAAQAFQAFHWLSKTALLHIVPQITRVIAALALLTFFPNPKAMDWALLYFVSTVICAIIAVQLVHRSLGKPKPALSRIQPEVGEGFYFSISASAQTIYNDIDKTMLARLSTLEATGIYAAAYRLIDVAFVPVRSLLLAAVSKFFQYGATGIKGSVGVAKRLLPITGIYGAIAGIGLFFFAPVVPLILGDEYKEAAEVLRWLAPLALIKGIHYFAADALAGAGFQRLRTIAQAGVAIFNILLNLWLIPLYSWRGAAISSVATDGLLMVTLWIIVAKLYRKPKPL